MKNLLIATGVSLLVCSSVFAQQSTGSIAGRVLDPQGSAIAGATVTARNSETGLGRTSLTDEAGLYRLAALPVGVYEVTLAKEGFATLSQKSIDVSVAETQTIEFKPQIATIAQQVTVVGAAPLIDVTSSSLGQVVDPRRVQDLPV